MKKKMLIIGMSILLAIPLPACGQNQEEEEDIVFGDIDLTIEYGDGQELPSLVERAEEVDISKYLQAMPMTETAEMVSSTLPTFAGDKYRIDRVQYNGVYFDINQVANQYEYTREVKDNILTLTIPREDGSTVVAKVAQVADKAMLAEGLTDAELSELSDLVEEYEQTYRDDANQAGTEYGYYYTYDKYVEFMNEHEGCKYDVTMYSPSSVLQLALDIFGIDKDADSFYVNTRADMLEVSDWYLANMNFNYEEPGEKSIDISVKTSSNGTFIFMTEYEQGTNLDENGDIYYTPTMIINIAQNNYYQKGETYAEYTSRVYN